MRSGPCRKVHVHDDPTLPMSDLAIRWLPGRRSTAVHGTRVRCRLPARLLRQSGLDARLLRRREHPLGGPVDVLVLQDPSSAEHVEIARAAAITGTTVVVDLSDPGAACSDIGRAVAAHASTVTVPSPGLGKIVEHPRVAFVDDAVEWAHPSPPVSARPRPGEPARIVWFGRSVGTSAGTGLSELASIQTALREMAGRRRLELVLVTDDRTGAEAFLRSGPIPGRWVDWSPWRLRSVLSAAHVCVLPAGSPEIALRRSANRAITAIVQGVPVVADPVPSYEALGAGVSFGSWTSHIERLLADQPTAEQQVGAGRDAIRRRFADDRIVGQWSTAIAAARHHADELSGVGAPG